MLFIFFFWICISLYHDCVAEPPGPLNPHMSFDDVVHKQTNRGADAGWTEMVWCLARDDVRGAKAHEASGQAVDLVLVELVLCLIVQSASFMYRYIHRNQYQQLQYFRFGQERGKFSAVPRSVLFVLFLFLFLSTYRMVFLCLGVRHLTAPSAPVPGCSQSSTPLDCCCCRWCKYLETYFSNEDLLHYLDLVCPGLLHFFDAAGDGFSVLLFPTPTISSFLIHRNAGHGFSVLVFPTISLFLIHRNAGHACFTGRLPRVRMCTEQICVRSLCTI